MSWYNFDHTFITTSILTKYAEQMATQLYVEGIIDQPWWRTLLADFRAWRVT